MNRSTTMTSDARWCIDDARLSRLVSPNSWNFNPEWSPILDDDDAKSLWRRFPMPHSSSESHLDFSSDDSDGEEEVEAGRIEPFTAGNGDDDDDDSLSDCSDGDSDAMSFVLRESARALIEDVEFRDVEMPSHSSLESKVLDMLDDQLKNDPRASWTAICWRDAAPEDVPQTSEQNDSHLRPRLLTTCLDTRHHSTSRSPVTPGDPILARTPPLSTTPRSSIRLLPVTATPCHPNTMPDFTIAAPVPRYRPMSDPPPYSASASPGTWAQFACSAHSISGKTSSPFTPEASDADNEASTDDGMSDSRASTERSSDFDSSSSSSSSSSTSDRRSNSNPSLATSTSTPQDVSVCPSPSPSPAPSSFLLPPHAYSSFSSAFTKVNSSPSVRAGLTSAATPTARSAFVSITPAASSDHSPPPSCLASPLDKLALPFPLFSASSKPSEAINFAPERPTSPPAPHHHNYSQYHKGRKPLSSFHPLAGTWKGAATTKEDASALQRFASRCSTLSRKLTTVAAGAGGGGGARS